MAEGHEKVTHRSPLTNVSIGTRRSRSPSERRDEEGHSLTMAKKRVRMEDEPAVANADKPSVLPELNGGDTAQSDSPVGNSRDDQNAKGGDDVPNMKRQRTSSETVLFPAPMYVCTPISATLYEVVCSAYPPREASNKTEELRWRRHDILREMNDLVLVRDVLKTLGNRRILSQRNFNVVGSNKTHGGILSPLLLRAFGAKHLTVSGPIFDIAKDRCDRGAKDKILQTFFVLNAYCTTVMAAVHPKFFRSVMRLTVGLGEVCGENFVEMPRTKESNFNKNTYKTGWILIQNTLLAFLYENTRPLMFSGVVSAFVINVWQPCMISQVVAEVVTWMYVQLKKVIKEKTPAPAEFTELIAPPLQILFRKMCETLNAKLDNGSYPTADTSEWETCISRCLQDGGETADTYHIGTHNGLPWSINEAAQANEEGDGTSDAP